MVPPDRNRRNDSSILRHDPYANHPPSVQPTPPSTPRSPFPAALPDPSIALRPQAGRAGRAGAGSPSGRGGRIMRVRRNTMSLAGAAPRRRPPLKPPLWARCCRWCIWSLIFLVLIFVVGGSGWKFKKWMFDNEDVPYIFDQPDYGLSGQMTSSFGQSGSSYVDPVQSETSSSYESPVKSETSTSTTSRKEPIFTQWSDRAKKSTTSTQRKSEGKKSKESSSQKPAKKSSITPSKSSLSKPTGPESIPPGPAIPKSDPPPQHPVPMRVASCVQPPLPLQIASAEPPQDGLTTFPIDGLLMSSPDDIFAHLINLGLLLYRAPIYNLPAIRSLIVPQAFVLQGLMDSQVSVHTGKRLPEADGVFKSLNNFINSLPGTTNGEKIQNHDARLSGELEKLRVEMNILKNGGNLKGRGWGFWNHEGDIESEFLRVLKLEYGAARYYHSLVTKSIEKHKRFVKVRVVYLKHLRQADPRKGPADSELEIPEQRNENCLKAKEGVNVFWEMSEGMMVGLRSWEKRLKEVLDQEKAVIRRFKTRTEGGGRRLQCDILSLGHLIGWVQHSFMVERRYNEGYF